MAKDPYRYFRIEAGELLDQLAKSALALEKGNFNADVVLRLLRLAHTLKGAARVVKQAEIADLAHRVEDFLSPFRDGTQILTRETVDSVLGALDAITAQLSQLPTPESREVKTVAPEASMRMVRTDLIEVDALLEGLGEIGNELGGVRRAVVSMERIRNLASQISSQQAMSSTKLKSVTDEIQILVAAVERAMSAGVERIDRELREARDGAERLRLVPVSSVFNALERTARDAAHSMGKQVEFAATGGDVRIDGAVLDSVQSALIQLVRNAVAHGVETKAERSAAGKPPVGRITVEVERRGYRALFRCKDDGVGVDMDAVRRALQKNGLSMGQLQKMDAAALLVLLLKGGVSTAPVVTEIAGRGIGLNLVSEVMQKLNGEVVAHSNRGTGTTIELSVPLSLAALAVLMVENNASIAALPLDAVKCTLRISPEEIVRSPNGESILYEGKQIPLSPLSLGAPQKMTRMKTPAGSYPMARSMDRPLTAVILTAAGRTSAVAVERLCGIDNVVLRPLPSLCSADPIVLGVYLDSEGNPCLVLDPEVLAAPCQIDTENRGQKAAQKSSHPILIIDDSLTTRMLESSILESAGFFVELATSAEEGLEKARRNRYALFLVDVEMPGMDGFSFVESTLIDPLLRDVPSILVTSRNSVEDRQRSKACGARAHIVKGEFDQVEFLERVAELVLQ
jgi:two-component system chemotaxis sensor kinase CheA